MDVRKRFVQDRLAAGGALTTVELPVDRADDVPPVEQVVCDRVMVDTLLSARDREMVNDSALETIIRTRVGGESLVDVAAEMNLSPDAMWRRRSRAEQRLRELPLAS
jgi:hypothetical protein